MTLGGSFPKVGRTQRDAPGKVPVAAERGKRRNRNGRRREQRPPLPLRPLALAPASGAAGAPRRAPARRGSRVVRRAGRLRAVARRVVRRAVRRAARRRAGPRAARASPAATSRHLRARHVALLVDEVEPAVFPLHTSLRNLLRPAASRLAAASRHPGAAHVASLVEVVEPALLSLDLGLRMTFVAIGLSFSVGCVLPATGRRDFGGETPSEGRGGPPADARMIPPASDGVNRRFKGLPSELPAAFDGPGSGPDARRLAAAPCRLERSDPLLHPLDHALLVARAVERVHLLDPGRAGRR